MNGKLLFFSFRFVSNVVGGVPDFFFIILSHSLHYVGWRKRCVAIFLLFSGNRIEEVYHAVSFEP